MLLKTSIAITLLLYFSSILMVFSAFGNCMLRTIFDFFKLMFRVKKKFPKKEFDDRHLGLFIKVVGKTCKKVSINGKVIDFNDKTPKPKKTNKKVPKHILYLFFGILFLFLPAINSIILREFFYTKSKITRVLISIIFDFIYPLSILFVLGYGLSEINIKLSIVVMCFYILLVLWGNFEQYISINKIVSDKKGFQVQVFINILLGLIVGFASIYYNLFNLNHNNLALSNLHTFGIIDSLYFSIVTFATVGYGDIAPSSHISRLFCSAEILISIFVLIFLAGLYINAYIIKANKTNL